MTDTTADSGSQPAPAMTDEEARDVVARLAPTGAARRRVFGVLLRHLTADAGIAS